MFPKLETAEEPCRAGMRSASDHTIALHITLQATLKNDKWISPDKSHTSKCCLLISAERLSQGIIIVQKLYRAVNKTVPILWTGCQVSLNFFVFEILTLEGFMLIHVLIQILSFVVKSFSLNKDPQQSKVVKIGKCPEGLSWDFYHHQ